jgi:hypothetical protein
LSCKHTCNNASKCQQNYCNVNVFCCHCCPGCICSSTYICKKNCSCNCAYSCVGSVCNNWCPSDCI